jgi:hypothetical protein
MLRPIVQGAEAGFRAPPRIRRWPEMRIMREGFAAYLPRPCNLGRISALVARLTRCEAASGFVAEQERAMAV